MARLPKFVGPYVVERRLGSGGMGLVLFARHRLLGRAVAVKLRLCTEDPDEALLAERFRQGAILQAELDHPNVARVFDYLESPMVQALVLEYLAGGSVQELIEQRGGPLPVPMAIDIGVRSAEALSYGHERGVVHRDVKPANLMLRESQDSTTVRVTDFGVAKSLGRSPDLTIAGANVGTLWYMPPEQFNHEELTPLVDVYALGASVYEMLTGHIPFHSSETSEIFRRFLDGEPPPPVRWRNPLVPSGVAAVVEGALALRPEERVPSAAAFSLLLRAVAEREAVMANEARDRRLLASPEGDELRGYAARLSGEDGETVNLALDQLVARLGGGSVYSEAPEPLVAEPTTNFTRLSDADKTPPSAESVFSSIVLDPLDSAIEGLDDDEDDDDCTLKGD